MTADSIDTPPPKLPAREHAAKVVAELVKLLPETERSGEANFNYITGAHDVIDASVLVVFQDAQIEHTLFVPPADPLVTMWSVAPPTLEDAEVRFDADAIKPSTEIGAAASSLAGATLHIMPLTHEFPPLPESISAMDKNDKYLREAFHNARLTKTEREIDLVRTANAVTSAAHEVLMRELGRYAAQRAKASGAGTKARSGFEGVADWEVESEADAEALFVATCRRLGAEQAYLPIVASGSHASTLHYVCNDRVFPSMANPRAAGDTSFTPRRLARGCCGDVPGHDHATPVRSLHSAAFEPQVLLIDAGADWQGYASDVTRTMPVGNGGKFTERAGEVYDIVLRMQKECEERCRVGVHWDELHLHAHTVLVEEFIRLGIFKGSKEEVLQSGLSASFFPHGLGHSLGLDVHDSLQLLRTEYLDLPESTKNTPEKLYTYLRIRRVLQDKMVLTIEPGCYFAPQLMDMGGVWESPLVDQEVLKTYLGVGGVRIEDVVVVREGRECENLTTVGREREWVEARCSGRQ